MWRFLQGVEKVATPELLVFPRAEIAEKEAWETLEIFPGIARSAAGRFPQAEKTRESALHLFPRLEMAKKERRALFRSFKRQNNAASAGFAN
jgi:hypothetical protein